MGTETPPSSTSQNSFKPHIVVVEDNREFRYLLRRILEEKGYKVTVFQQAAEVLEYCSVNPPDLLLVDIKLPDASGIELCKQVKQVQITRGAKRFPVVILSGLQEDEQVIDSFSGGADDYMFKSYSVPVLLTRISRFLGTGAHISAVDNSQATATHSFHNIVCPESGEKILPSGEQRFTLTEALILSKLVNAAGEVLSRNQLIAAAHGEGYHVTDRTIDVHVANLRKKLGKFDKQLCTVRGHGYRWVVGGD